VWTRCVFSPTSITKKIVETAVGWNAVGVIGSGMRRTVIPFKGGRGGESVTGRCVDSGAISSPEKVRPIDFWKRGKEKKRSLIRISRNGTAGEDLRFLRKKGKRVLLGGREEKERQGVSVMKMSGGESRENLGTQEIESRRGKREKEDDLVPGRSKGSLLEGVTTTERREKRGEEFRADKGPGQW